MSMRQSAEYILEHCDLLVKENCFVHDGKLYEKLDVAEFGYPDGGLTMKEEFRVFFSDDHYDYCEDPRK